MEAAVDCSVAVVLTGHSTAAAVVVVGPYVAACENSIESCAEGLADELHLNRIGLAAGAGRSECVVVNLVEVGVGRPEVPCGVAEAAAVAGAVAVDWGVVVRSRYKNKISYKYTICEEPL